MKYFFILLLICSYKSFAQTAEVFRIDSLPTNGLVLNKNWKWHAGDNLEYAKLGFDESLPKISIVPQDISRVMLNLINNAFYAVNEKLKLNIQNYQPQVVVRTKRIGDRVEISVKDNGNGIPDKIKDKIFQPFFTTKPTGEGTGLGLSLSFDIITKGHSGELKVQSVEGEGSEFIIIFPRNK